MTSKGREIAEELDIPTSSNGVISYNSLKRILYETGLTWETRDDVVEIRKAWHGGRWVNMLFRFFVPFIILKGQTVLTLNLYETNSLKYD